MKRRRSPLGTLMVAARRSSGLSLRGLAAAIDAAPSYVSDIETGRRFPSVAMLGELFRVLDVPQAEHDRWYAAAETLAPEMLDALLAQPDAWDDVRALLAARGRP